MSILIHTTVKLDHQLTVNLDPSLEFGIKFEIEHYKNTRNWGLSWCFQNLFHIRVLKCIFDIMFNEV